MRDADFLTVPHREAKPRRSGLTHVIDAGLATATVAGRLDTVAAYIDVWKFGSGTAYLDRCLSEKVDLLRRADVLPCLGGTLLEIAWAQGVADACLDWAADAGLTAVEVSRGLVPMAAEQKWELIRRARAAGFEVMAEVGAKDPTTTMPPAEWAAEALGDLAAGARWVVVEGRESGTVGIYLPDGSVRVDVVDAVVGTVGAEALIFEAPRKDQQAWFISRFGPDVNLGNISADAVLPLETLRRGLRADTWAALHTKAMA